jgi:Na+-translocating ferredoxin:NAD+ oxidoreductase RNF subunit RnfB
MISILAAVLTLTVLGLLFGLLLAVGSKIFAVEQDERIPQVQECLPGANCGGCGYAGCANLAEAIVNGEAAVNTCPVGGAETAQKIAEIMGVEAGETVKMTAYVRCSGGNNASRKYDYVGAIDCLAAMKVAGGPLECTFGCLGYGSCAKVCPNDAISIVDGKAVVNSDACIACGKCVGACPRNIIAIVPANNKTHVACVSKAKGGEVRKICQVGCIGCGICVKNCPHEAITVVDNVARIDYSKCQDCGKCAEVCPRKIITK